MKKFRSWSHQAVRDPKGPYKPTVQKDKKKAIKKGERKHKGKYENISKMV